MTLAILATELWEEQKKTADYPPNQAPDFKLDTSSRTANTSPRTAVILATSCKLGGVIILKNTPVKENDPGHPCSSKSHSLLTPTIKFVWFSISRTLSKDAISVIWNQQKHQYHEIFLCYDVISSLCIHTYMNIYTSKIHHEALSQVSIYWEFYWIHSFVFLGTNCYYSLWYILGKASAQK